MRLMWPLVNMSPCPTAFASCPGRSCGRRLLPSCLLAGSFLWKACWRVPVLAGAAECTDGPRRALRVAVGCALRCRFQRSVLDLSLQWRFANLPNNAKLEMVPASRSREGPENTVGARGRAVVPLLLAPPADCGLRGATQAGEPGAGQSGSRRQTVPLGQAEPPPTLATGVGICPWCRVTAGG